jgi:D-alanine-D-alanine ligase
VDVGRSPHVLIVHNPVAAGADPATADVLAQAEMVEAGLAALGLSSSRLAVAGPDLCAALAGSPGAVVFNLIEAPTGFPHLGPAAAAALELLGLPFTGSAAAALWLTTDKLATRALLAAEGLPVAPGVRFAPARPDLLDRVPPPWIVKPACEDASVGLEGNPVCAGRDAVGERASELARRFPGQPVLVESFLPGREFNVSLLAGAGGVEVLPVAEIAFESFPDGLPRVVGYEAKWEEDSFAYHHTVRRFPGPDEEPLLARLRSLSLAACHACGVAGYGRVDLRLDAAGEPCILEMNANPCLAAGAGFLAAAAAAGLTERDVVARILAAVPGGKGQALLRRDAGRPRSAGHGERAPRSVIVRHDLRPADRAPLEALVRATGFFNPEEVEVALELVDDRLAHGEASHYRFLVGEVAGEVAGYACWGPIAGTRESADLYWIAVHPGHQGVGVGRALLCDAEAWISAAGRHRVYVETSTRAQYIGTRRFYLSCGYQLAAELPDFYAPGDGKAIFVRVV